jgi:hypothetical protein
VFQPKWKDKGTIEDSKKTNYSQKPKRREKPILIVKDQRFYKGEPVDLSKLATAKEWGQDGKDLTDKIEWIVTGGNLAIRQGVLDTTHTGKAYITFFVTSTNGLTSEKKITILVDIKEDE